MTTHRPSTWIDPSNRRRRRLRWLAFAGLALSIPLLGAARGPHPRPRDVAITEPFDSPPAAATAAGMLDRRAFLGIRAGLLEGGAIGVLGVFPDSTAARLGVEAGDEIVSVRGEALDEVADLPRLVGDLHAGDRLELRVRRHGEDLLLHGRLEPFPKERGEGYEVSYGEVRSSRGYLMRTLTTRPEGASGALPAILYLQGLGCSSLERPFPGPDPQRELLADLTRAGFVTLRVDKPGAGDSQGPPCESVDLEEELAGYAAGLAALRRTPGVDADRIALFGFSMGGVMAPLLARDQPVAAIVVYGTISRSFFEYSIENARRQLGRQGLPPEEGERWLRRNHEFFARMLFDRLSPAEVRERHPHLEGVPDNASGELYAGRDYRFFVQLQQLVLPAVWERLRVPTLALHGEFDWVSGAGDHEEIARAVSRGLPDGGAYREVPGLDHGMTRHPDLAASHAAYGRGEPSDEVARRTLKWLAEVLPAPANSNPSDP